MAFWIGMAIFMGLIIAMAVIGGAVVSDKKRRRRD
jgi:hypothetical protein